MTYVNNIRNALESVEEDIVAKTTWNNEWKREANRDFWNKSDDYVIQFANQYNIGDDDVVLDLGCGIGRHTIYCAQRGAYVYAVDESSTAIEKLTLESTMLNLKVQTAISDYLLFNASVKFDYIIAFNVIYHGDITHFKSSILKCYDLLKPNGKLFFTCPSRSDDKYGNGNYVAEHTYESLNSIHPGDMHYFTDEVELKSIMGNLFTVIINKEEHYWDNRGVSQFASNYVVVAERCS